MGGLNSEQARWGGYRLVVQPAGSFRLLRQALEDAAAALGAGVDVDQAVREVLQARPNQRLCLRANVDAEAVKRYVRALDGRLSVEPVEATASLAGLQPVIEGGKPGIALNRVKRRSGSGRALRWHGGRGSCRRRRARSRRGDARVTSARSS